MENEPLKRFPSIVEWQESPTVDPREDIALEELNQLVFSGRWSRDDADIRACQIDWLPLANKRASLGHRLPEPMAVIWPGNEDDIARLMAWARKMSVCLVPRGAGSSVVGGAIAKAGCVVVDLSEMNMIGEIDDISQSISVQAGVMGGTLESHVSRHGYTLGHYPQSLDISTVGGWVATRASGTFSAGYGNIEDMVIGLRLVLPSGEILDVPASPRKSTGPDLKNLFIGSEGILGIVTRVDLSLRKSPPRRLLRGFAFGDLESGLETLRMVTQHPLAPHMSRLYDEAEAAHLLGRSGHDAGEVLLLIGWDGTDASVELCLVEALSIAVSNGGRDLGADIAEDWYENRFDVSALETGIVRPNGLADTIEVSMLWKDAGSLYEHATRALEGHAARILGHFSHTYNSGVSLYLIFFIEQDDDVLAEKEYLKAWEAVMDVVLQHGGSISHHHGIGALRVGWMKAELGSAYPLMADIKSMLDPTGILNPGKLIPTMTSD